MPDEPVTRVLQRFPEPTTRVRMIDHDSKHVAPDPVLPKGNLDNIVGWVHVDTHRAVAIDVRVLVAAKVVHAFHCEPAHMSTQAL